MFTGIIRHQGRVARVEDLPGGARRLVVDPRPAIEGVRSGDSVAIDGVCLTVCAQPPEGLAFDVVPETLRRTTLGGLGAGDRVHLEPSMRLGDELGGHWVQGHVEGTAEIVALERRGEDVRLVLAADEALAGGLLPKGSVTLDGVSLTVGEVWREGAPEGTRFSVYLVPHTLELTTLGGLAAGDRVNVEPDVLGRWVEHHVERWLRAADRTGRGSTPEEAAP